MISLFTMVRKWEQPGCPSRIDNENAVCTQQIAIKKDGIMKLERKLIELQSIMFNKDTDSETQKHLCM